MTTPFFWQFLLEKGLISPDKLLRVMSAQGATNLRIGDLAVRERMMLPEQSRQVVEKQQQLDKRFGEIAVSLNFLTNEQVDALLALQKIEHVQFAQALSRTGILAPTTVERYLAEFRAQIQDDSEAVGLALRVPHSKQMRDLAHLTNRLMRRRAGVLGRAGVANVMNGVLEPSEVEAWTEFNGYLNGRYILRMSKVLALQISLTLSSGETRTPAEMLDAVKEFCNVVAGNFCAQLADEGRTCTIAPTQGTLDTKSTPVRAPYALFPFYTAFGELQVVFEPTEL